MINFKITICKISLTSISFEITVPNLILAKNDIDLTLNNTSYYDFTLIQDNTQKKLYTLKPNSSFSINDILYMEIKNPFFSSNNKCKILFSQPFKNGESLIDFKLSNNSKGSYRFNIESLNGLDFNLNSNPVMVSKSIQPSLSKVIPEKETYNSGEIIVSNLYLLDIDDTPVPDGLYEVELYSK
ncbi:hypothetical protein [Clostridium botulinum]|uniref:hypothetical protein n=1 Tax=Clostridium botulinum TaxID=1491 RepID=UPI0004D8606A|nr:hypothetical protein [Clostridium botulinum]KEI05464.1 hypothetical protein Z952_05320 [Clostridium botulinum C/D str. BKT75002]KEI09415.1 hypothetical protein Z954_12850 [Clostridium botulinum C/D str. BKT2873]QPW61483.1 hypothetical protein IG390_04760 [Clostridium botulinum]